MNIEHFLPRQMPEGLEGLSELAFDLRWSAGNGAVKLWQALEPKLWQATENPVLLIESVSHAQLEKAAKDREFMHSLRNAMQARQDSDLLGSAWPVLCYPVTPCRPARIIWPPRAG